MRFYPKLISNLTSYIMELIEITTPALAKDFIRANVELNGQIPHYIRPLDKDINEVFDPAKTKPSGMGNAPAGS